MQQKPTGQALIDPMFKVYFPDDPRVSVSSLYIWHHLPDDFSRAQFMALLECPDPYEELQEVDAIRISELLNCFISGLATKHQIEACSWFVRKSDSPINADFIRYFLYGDMSFDDLEARYAHDGDDGVACNAANLEYLQRRFSVDSLAMDMFDRRQPVTLADFVVEFFDAVETIVLTKREVEYDP